MNDKIFENTKLKPCPHFSTHLQLDTRKERCVYQNLKGFHFKERHFTNKNSLYSYFQKKKTILLDRVEGIG